MALQVLRVELLEKGSVLFNDLLGLVKKSQDIFVGITKSLEKNSDGKFSPSIDADINNILVVYLHIDPGTPYRDDSSGVNNLA